MKECTSGSVQLQVSRKCLHNVMQLQEPELIIVIARYSHAINLRSRCTEVFKGVSLPVETSFLIFLDFPETFGEKHRLKLFADSHYLLTETICGSCIPFPVPLIGYKLLLDVVVTPFC